MMPHVFSIDAGGCNRLSEIELYYIQLILLYYVPELGQIVRQVLERAKCFQR